MTDLKGCLGRRGTDPALTSLVGEMLGGVDFPAHLSRDGTMELEEYGIDKATLQRMYDEWRSGTPKSELERRYLGKGESHGKTFTALVRRHLNIETEKTHPLVKENQKLTVRLKELEVENKELKKQLRLDI